MLALNTSPPYCDCPPGVCAILCPPSQQLRCKGIDPRTPDAQRYATAYQLRTSRGYPPPDGTLASEIRSERTFLAKSTCRHQREAGYPPGSCSCPAIVPIYHCTLHDCRCSDFRELPAVRFCSQCPDKS